MEYTDTASKTTSSTKWSEIILAASRVPVFQVSTVGKQLKTVADIGSSALDGKQLAGCYTWNSTIIGDLGVPGTTPLPN